MGLHVCSVANVSLATGTVERVPQCPISAIARRIDRWK
jgi:hypothetical protein